MAINMTLIIAVSVLAYYGHDVVATALVGALAVVNVTTLFAPISGKDNAGNKTHSSSTGEE